MEDKKITEEELLYDPLFDQKPVLDWTDSKKGGLFGKSKVKKTLFILLLILAIGGSLFFSFNSISKNTYEYEALENGTYKLSEFNGQKTDTVLCLDYVRGEDGKADETKKVTAVRQFASTGNDTLQFIFVGKDVAEIEKTAFYYCTALNAIFVDEANEHYASVDGILYKKENGVLTEAVLCPQRHTRYLYAVSTGIKAPANAEEAGEFAAKLADEIFTAELDEKAAAEENTVGKSVDLPKTVKKIDQLCFAYCDLLQTITLPEGLTEIETMAFFNCSALNNVELPDSLEIIGSDAFSKCKSIDYLFLPKSVRSIGHHAFWNCDAIEKVYVEAENLDGIETGKNWMPQYRKVFMKNRETVFSAKRGVK